MNIEKSLKSKTCELIEVDIIRIIKVENEKMF